MVFKDLLPQCQKKIYLCTIVKNYSQNKTWIFAKIFLWLQIIHKVGHVGIMEAVMQKVIIIIVDLLHINYQHKTKAQLYVLPKATTNQQTTTSFK